MTPSAPISRSHPAPADARAEPLLPTDDERSRVAARPDGFYWVADDGRQEFGPFASAMDALVALRSGIETGLEPDQTLQDAEAEIGFVEPPRSEEGLPPE